MEKKCFLNDASVIDEILRITVTSANNAAKELNAKQGASVAAIVFNGKLYLQSEALCGDVTAEFDPKKSWEGDPTIGINYVGYAIGKVMQTVRTGYPSKDGAALGYGEADDVGSHREVCFCKATDDSQIQFMLIIAFSGLSSEEDYKIARAASRDAWYKMSGYKNPDGSSTKLCRIAGMCQ